MVKCFCIDNSNYRYLIPEDRVSADDTLESMAKQRHDNNLYMGTIASRRFQKANDEFVLNNK